jgi:hypothetical protein
MKHEKLNETVAEIIYVILSAAKDLDSLVASLPQNDNFFQSPLFT